MKRPLVTIKLATSLDGRIALNNGMSRWITSPQSRQHSHRLRAAHAALVIGSGTATADDPLLTVRCGPVPATQPARIVVSSTARLRVDSRLVRSIDDAPVVLATTTAATTSALDELRTAGVSIWQCDPEPYGVGPSSFLDQCANAGIDSVMIEGGGQLAASFIRQKLVDRLEWFRAPVLVGADGTSAIGPLGIVDIKQMPRFTCIRRVEPGGDIWETYTLV